MSARLGSYAEWQHAHESTPRSVLAEVVRRAVGTGIDRADRIVEGYSNEVYRVRCANRQDVVVRIHRVDDEDLAINGVRVDGERDSLTTMAAKLGDRYSARDKVLAGGFSAPEFDRMLDLLEGYVRDFPCEHGVLCHGDLSLKHIFVTGDDGDSAAVRVSGIIDFGDWQPGARVHDLAVLRVREAGLDLPPLLIGYGAPAGRAFQRQLELHTLIIALDSLEFGVSEDDQASIERSGHLIRTLVADLGHPDFSV